MKISHGSLKKLHNYFISPLHTAQKKNRVKIWLYEDTRMIIEGQIIGFDEYMNFVLDGATEIDSKTGKRTDVGRILLKGDSITLLQEA
jgi:small nuclear ribonucleoprotein E